MKNIIKQIVMNTRRTFLPPYREGRGGSWTRVGLLLAIVMMAMSPMKMWADDYTITVVDAKSNTGDLPEYLFDGNRDKKWCTTGFTENGAYIIFKIPTAAQMTEYTITDGGDTHSSNFYGRHWNSWTIYGGNFDSDENAKNGVGDWTVVDSQSGQAYTNQNWQSYNTFQTTSFTVNNAGPYKYYKLVITGIGASYPSWNGGLADDCQQMAEMSITFTEPVYLPIDVTVTKSGDSQAMLSKQIATLITLNYNNGATQIKAQNGDTDENPATASLAHGYIYNLTITDATNIGAGSDTDLPDGNIIAHAPRRLPQVSELTGPTLVLEGATNPVYYLNNGSVTLAKVNGKYMVNNTKVEGTVSNIYISDVHHYTTFPAVAATCTSTGNIAYQKCSVCEKKIDMEGNEVTNVIVPIDPTAHNLSHTASQAATCTAQGWHEYWYCSRCSKYFKDENGSEAYTDDTNETTGVWIAITHSYPEFFDSNGLKTCSKCGEIVGEEPTKVSDESSSFNGYYAISKPGHLAWFRDFVNTVVEVEGAKTYPNTGAKAYLADNISMSALCHAADATNGIAKVNWTPIALYGAFTGIFDGNNKTISNLYINTNNSYMALFGNAAEDAEIKNLTVNGTVVGSEFTALILAYAEDRVKLTNCKSEGSVTGTDDYTAGIVAYFNADYDNMPTISGCKNTATVTSTYYGWADAGGIVGDGEYINLTKCTNEGTVTAAGKDVGGIAGYIYNDTYDSNIPVYISECTNTGAVSSTYNSNAYVGGIAGNACDVNVSKCTNVATVTADGSHVGGLAGYIYSVASGSSIKDCYTTGDVVSTKTYNAYAGGAFGYLCCPTVSNVYSAATITKDAAATHCVGAFAGDVEYSTLTNCYYDSDKTNLSFIGESNDNTIDASANGGKSAADFASGEICYLFNGSRSAGTEESPLVWYQAIGLDAYPTFEQGQYAIVKYDATDGYYNDMENFASIELVDGTAYEAKLNRTADELTYTRTFGGTNWTTWYVPFDLTLTSEICAKYEFSRINNVHQYEDEDGDVDETVVESFLQNSGVKLKANYPYLVRAKSDADKEMTLNLNDATVKAAKTNSIFCQSIDYKYTFTGTYSAMGNGEDESAEYSLFDDNADGWKNFQTLKPQRHYLTITSRDGSSSNKAPRRIMLKVVGEENATGIVTLYDNTSATGNDGKYLENGKIVIVRNGKKYNTNGQVIR